MEKKGFRTVGARELAKAGYTEIYEVVIKYKGPGLWYEAAAPSKPGSGPRDWSPRRGEQVLILRQGRGAWHVFYRYKATSSGGDPLRALRGGLGDAIGSDDDLERYCELVLSAPRRLADEYDGLYEAQGQCYHERREG